MAASIKTIDTDIITLRQINVRSATNGFIPGSNVLVSNGAGGGYWTSVSSILPTPFYAVSDANGSTMSGNEIGPTLPISTVGVQGLFSAYVDFASSTFTFSNAYPNLLVALNTVPTVSRQAAQIVPSSENIFMSSGQSTLKFIGVGDIQLSTVTDLRTVFFSISSFTARGYADLSGETRAWRGYVYSTTSTTAGYGNFVSSMPVSTFYHLNDYVGYGWDWTPLLTSNLPLSTVETYPNFTSGDVYFSTLSFPIDPFIQYIHPNSTTKMFLEVTPSYFFQRMYLGHSTPMNLIKEFSTFVQYESPTSGRQIMSKSANGSYMFSQTSNAYASNYYNAPLRLELDTAMIMSNVLRDGLLSNNYYTLYHRIPGAMASLVSDGYCGYNIDARGGFSNQLITYDNNTAYNNAVFLRVCNQPGATPPMPGP